MNEKPNMVPISPVCDLSTPRGRSLCVRYSLNIARVLVSLQDKYPEGSLVRLGDKVVTPNSTVNIFGEFVIKRTNKHSGDVLKDLYGLIEQSRPPGLISSQQGVKLSSNALTVRLVPVGFCGKLPGSLTEIRAAGRQILEGLQWLHGHGWVHRDIRPQNILFADGRWYLMDLEWANKIDSPIGTYNLQHQYCPPEVAWGEDQIWTAASDMWQFGKLVGFWNTNVACDSYVHVQTSERPEDRLTAADSLQHELFAT